MLENKVALGILRCIIKKWLTADNVKKHARSQSGDWACCDDIIKKRLTADNIKKGTQ